MKFSLEAQKLKDEIFGLYNQQDQTSRQWISIVERLPIGMMLVNRDKVAHFNGQMSEMLGSTIFKD
jgi:hypothetical protein